MIYYKTAPIMKNYTQEAALWAQSFNSHWSYQEYGEDSLSLNISENIWSEVPQINELSLS